MSGNDIFNRTPYEQCVEVGISDVCLRACMYFTPFVCLFETVKKKKQRLEYLRKKVESSQKAADKETSMAREDYERGNRQGM